MGAFFHRSRVNWPLNLNTLIILDFIVVIFNLNFSGKYNNFNKFFFLQVPDPEFPFQVSVHIFFGFPHPDPGKYHPGKYF